MPQISYTVYHASVRGLLLDLTGFGKLGSLELFGDIEILIIDLVQFSVNLIIFSESESIYVRKKQYLISSNQISSVNSF